MVWFLINIMSYKEKKYMSDPPCKYSPLMLFTFLNLSMYTEIRDICYII